MNMNGNIGKAMGYTIGVFIVVPVIITVVNFLFFRGNQITKQQITQYINDSSTIEVFIPPQKIDDYVINIMNVEMEKMAKIENMKDTSKLKYETYSPKITQRGDNTKVIYRFTFYSKKYNRYMVLINFDGFEYYDGALSNHDHNYERNRVIYSGRYFMVRVNNKQWNDKNYGSEINPVPVFGVTLSGRGYEEFSPGVLVESRKQSDVSDKINRIFVEQYLNYFLPSDAYKKLFSE